MKYGVSVQWNSRRIIDRLIIPRLAPTQIMSYVSLGMTRPEWLKFLITAVAHKSLNLENPADIYRLILDDSWGWLFQAFLLKREAKEMEDDTSGYGTGFAQIQSSGSLAILVEGISAEKLYWDVVNDLLLELKPGNLDSCLLILNSCFMSDLDEEEARSRLQALVGKKPGQKKRGLFSLITWAINENLRHDFPAEEERGGLFTIPNQYLSIVQDWGVSQPNLLTKVQKVLCSEAPGKISRGLRNFEIAAICHEMSRSKGSKAILSSFIAFDLGRKNSRFGRRAECDSIMRDAYCRLPPDEEILRYCKRFYERISTLLTKRVTDYEIVTFREFEKNCGLEDIKKTAIFWEYNLIAGELEEALRDFIEEQYNSPPYTISFEKKWASLSSGDLQHLNQSIVRFEDLADRVRNYDEYVSSFQAGDEFMKSLPSWFDLATDGLASCKTSKRRVEFFFEKANNLSDSIQFDGESIEVLKAPTAVNPLIARGAFYNWLRCFLDIWKRQA